METEFARIRPRCDKVRSAERAQEVVERLFVGQVDDRKPNAPLVTVTVEQIVVANAEIKQMAGRDAWRVVIVIFGPGCWKADASRVIQGGTQVPTLTAPA